MWIMPDLKKSWLKSYYDANVVNVNRIFRCHSLLIKMINDNDDKTYRRYIWRTEKICYFKISKQEESL